MYGDGVGIGVGVEIGVDVGTRASVGVGMGTSVGVGRGVGVSAGVGVAVGAGVWEGVGVSVGTEGVSCATSPLLDSRSQPMLRQMTAAIAITAMFPTLFIAHLSYRPAQLVHEKMQPPHVPAGQLKPVVYTALAQHTNPSNPL